MCNVKARFDHGSQHGDKQSSITSVTTSSILLRIKKCFFVSVEYHMDKNEIEIVLLTAISKHDGSKGICFVPEKPTNIHIWQVDTLHNPTISDNKKQTTNRSVNKSFASHRRYRNELLRTSRISKCTFPRSPVPVSIHCRDGINTSFLIASLVIHAVSSKRLGSGDGRVLYCVGRRLKVAVRIISTNPNQATTNQAAHMYVFIPY